MLSWKPLSNQKGDDSNFKGSFKIVMLLQTGLLKSVPTTFHTSCLLSHFWGVLDQSSYIIVMIVQLWKCTKNHWRNVCFNWVNCILNYVSIKPGQNSFFAGNRKWSEVKVAQSCPTLCDPMDYKVNGILKARILEWVAFPFSRGSSQPRDRTQISCIAGGFFTSWTTREAQNTEVVSLSLL